MTLLLKRCLAVTRINLLGSVHITRSDGSPPSRAVYQPRKVAFLTALILGSDMISRGHLVGLLWPELPEGNARAALSQLLHALRSDLGDIFVTRGDAEIGIDRSRVGCDVVELRAACRRGESRTLLTAPSVELASSLDVGASRPFQEWIDAQRELLGADVWDGAWAGARALRESDGAAAQRLLELCLVARPYEESALRSLMTLHAEAGNGAAALAEYHRFAARVRENLDTKPSLDTTRLAGEIDARMPPSVTARDPAPAAAPDASVSKRPISYWNRSVFLGAAAVVLVAVVTVAWRMNARKPANAADAVPASTLRGGSIVIDVADVAGAATGPIGKLELKNAIVSRIAMGSRIVVGSTSDPGDRFTASIHLVAVSGGTEMDVRITRGDRILKSAVDTMDSDADVATAASRATLRVRTMLGQIIRDAQLARTSAIVRDIRRKVHVAAQHTSDGAFQQALDELNTAQLSAQAIPDSATDAESIRAHASVMSNMMTLRYMQGRLDAVDSIGQAGITLFSSGPQRNTFAGQLAIGEFWTFRAAIRSRREWLDSAMVHLRTAAALEPNDPRVWSSQSRGAYAMGDLNTALSTGERALASDVFLENADNMLMTLFLVSLQLGHDAKARSYCDRLNAEYPAQWFTVECSIDLVAFAGDTRVPITTLENRVRTVRGTGDADSEMNLRLRLGLAGAEAARGNRSRALAMIRDVHFPEMHTGAQLLTAVAFANAGDSAKARAIVQHVRSTPLGLHVLEINPRVLEKVGLPRLPQSSTHTQ